MDVRWRAEHRASGRNVISRVGMPSTDIPSGERLMFRVIIRRSA